MYVTEGNEEEKKDGKGADLYSGESGGGKRFLRLTRSLVSYFSLCF